MSGCTKMEQLASFIQELKTSPFYHLIFGKYPVMLLYVGGSRAIEVTDERSDYDLTAIVDGVVEEEQPDFCFLWKGKLVHWYYLSRDIYFVPSKNRPRLVNVAITQFRYVNDKIIVYRNEEYKQYVDELLEKKIELSRDAMDALWDSLSTYSEEIMAAGTVDEHHRSKLLYHLCRMYYELRGEPLDKDFLAVIKRIRWREVPEEYILKSVDILRQLKVLLNK